MKARKLEHKFWSWFYESRKILSVFIFNHHTTFYLSLSLVRLPNYEGRARSVRAYSKSAKKTAGAACSEIFNAANFGK